MPNRDDVEYTVDRFYNHAVWTIGGYHVYNEQLTPGWNQLNFGMEEWDSMIIPMLEEACDGQS